MIFQRDFHGDLNVFMKLMELEDVWIIEIWLEFEFLHQALTVDIVYAQIYLI